MLSIGDTNRLKIKGQKRWIMQTATIIKWEWLYRYQTKRL